MFTTQPVGTRGLFISFDEMVTPEGDPTTNIFIIETDQRVFICDTYLGPAALEPVLARYVNRDKPLVILNSHYHWDHVWGNCVFDRQPIIAHELCRSRIAQRSPEELKKFAHFIMGEVTITLPNLTFTTSLRFPDDGITIFHSPGHTEDSISVWDEVDLTLFAADNVEAPIPSCIESQDLATFANTIAGYLELDPANIVPGHGRLLTHFDLETNLQYIRDLITGETVKYESGAFRYNHLGNLHSLGK